jgi:hypothetical protein
MTTVKQEKTLLDEFAMAALTGLCSMQLNEFDRRYGKCNPVEIAYMLAGMMLEERQQYKFTHVNQTQLSMKQVAELVQEG